MVVGGKHLPGLPWIWMPKILEKKKGDQEIIPYEHFIFFQMVPQQSFFREVIFTYERPIIKAGKATFFYIVHCFGLHVSEKSFRR